MMFFNLKLKCINDIPSHNGNSFTKNKEYHAVERGKLLFAIDNFHDEVVVSISKNQKWDEYDLFKNNFTSQ